MRQPSISSEWLRTFITIVDAGGFIRAAEHLHKTQSTISQHIRRLEEETGTTLFTAQGRRRVLTPAGEAFNGYARKMLDLQNEAMLAIRQTAIEGEIRLGVSHSLSEGIFPILLGRFAASYPHVRISVTTDHSHALIQAFDRGEYDLTLTLEQGTTSGKVLGTEEMVWIGPENFHWQDNSQPLPLAAFTEPCQFRTASTQALDQAGIPWQIIYNANSLSGLMAAVRSGLAVTVRARHAVTAGTEILTPRLVLPELPGIQVVLRNRSVSAASELMADILSGNRIQAS